MKIKIDLCGKDADGKEIWVAEDIKYGCNGYGASKEEAIGNMIVLFQQLLDIQIIDFTNFK